MNCDEAFDLLTDLDLRHTPELRRHLDQCSRCRDMAETLSPILGLWDEAVGSASPSSALTAGSAGTRTSGIAAPVSVRREPMEEVMPQRRSSWSGARQWVAAFAAGLIVSMGFAVIDRPSRQSSAPLLPATACTWLERNADPALQEQSPQAVILSCVACHVKTPTAGGIITLPQL